MDMIGHNGELYRLPEHPQPAETSDKPEQGQNPSILVGFKCLQVNRGFEGSVNTPQVVDGPWTVHLRQALFEVFRLMRSDFPVSS